NNSKGKVNRFTSYFSAGLDVDGKPVLKVVSSEVPVDDNDLTGWIRYYVTGPDGVTCVEKVEMIRIVFANSVVWLGDSLTQGSLGSPNNNLDNAPYVKLRAYLNMPVEGYGFWAYNTRQIFSAYRNTHKQKVDPEKAYVFWVGSCDWFHDGAANTNTGPVIKQIDDFLASGKVTRYVVLGTTARRELRDGEKYKTINNALKAHYGEHYMDVVEIIDREGNGYSRDQVHLTQNSYDAIAYALGDKLKSMGYVK
ncbi:MAG: SGNH/GDSL hydrolase family protein, partial [Lachnospiraceae bacterium]|nr:SGNH/GDSL hydrolase family protein [Lachnospiraceae bacterium]